ncbi:ribosome recycling factor [Candidatus Amesbacteria bacterium]|nr:ribosome recycling factor [Candidatus Amesbacteria bacterium]
MDLGDTPNPAVVENVVINAYGGTAKLRVVELAMISMPEAQQLVISPYDQSVAGDVRRDLEAANLGVTPVLDNGVIRLTFPPLTAERRLELVKLLHVKLEEGRVKCRQIRHEKMSEFKRLFEEGTLAEDDRHRWEKELQEVTDKMMTMIEEMGKRKEEELMKV